MRKTNTADFWRQQQLHIQTQGSPIKLIAIYIYTQLEALSANAAHSQSAVRPNTQVSGLHMALHLEYVVKANQQNRAERENVLVIRENDYQNTHNATQCACARAYENKIDQSA